MTKTSPWEGILSAAMFALRATHHTTLQASPMQLVFGRDAFMNTKFEADWQTIKQRKQKIISKNNQRENAQRKPHTYQIGEKVLLETPNPSKAKFNENPYQGPYEVRQVNDNGTVLLDTGRFYETINIRNIKPYRE
jgi:hypothetical protein